MKDERIEEEIRKRAEHIPVPDSLQPEQIERKLKGMGQKSRIHRMGKRIAVVAAACLVLIAGTVWGTLQTNKKYTEPSQTAKVSEEEISSEESAGTSYEVLYDSIAEYFSNMEFTYRNYEGIAEEESEDASKSTSGQPAADFSDTDTQVDGILEGDIVKTDGSHIFTAGDKVNGSRIRIYKVNGKKATCLSKINLSQQDVLEMYVSGTYLVLLTENWESERNSKFKVSVYDVSDVSAPKKVVEHRQSGTYVTSRLVDGILYFYTDYIVLDDTSKKNKPETYVPSVDGEVVKEEDIARVTDESNNRYMLMTSLKIDQPQSFIDTFCAFGGSDVYYMNDNHIYVTERIYSDAEEDENRTQITMFSYASGEFSKEKSTQVRAVIENSYYMHEYNGYFCFVYTNYLDSDTTTNGLCVLDENMEVVGELENLGKNETIYSSYYIDNMAYFVTYRETDPVFAVDLSNPKKPILKSEIKLSGFSNYLHSFGKNQLVGIGYGGWEDQTVKFSLFEQDSKNRLSERSSELIGRHLSSIAGTNHKAVFIDEERGLLGLAVTGWNGNASYRLFHYQDGKWECILKQKHISSMYRVRGLRIGNYFYVVDVKKGIRGYAI
jgi:uncharacterized secreted protein with C-terminal beta-propeller domain